MSQYETLARFERDGLWIVVDKTWEETPLEDCFDDTCYQLERIRWQIENGDLDWFMLRVRAFVEDVELASSYLGGCLYESPTQVLEDGTVDDLLTEVIPEAQRRARTLYERLDRFAI